MRRKMLLAARAAGTCPAFRKVMRAGLGGALLFAFGLGNTANMAFAEQTRPKPRPPAVLDRALEGQMGQDTPSIATDPAAIDAAIRLAAGENAPAPATEAAAATAGAAPKGQDPGRGAVTNLPLPRYVSLKTGEGNARRGPGLSHRIDWVFTRAGMPLKLTAEHGHWRRIEDGDGFGGWVHYALLSGVRSVLVAEEMANFHTHPNPSAPVAFQAEAGVVAKIVSCKDEWCQISIDGNRAWAPYAALWGVDPGEIIE